MALVLHAAEPSWIGYSLAQLAPEMKALHASEPSFSKRLLAISSHFVGAPYQFSPLREAAGVDSDLLFTTSQFDCLSLVEISLALAASEDVDTVQSRLHQLRYMGDTVAYTERKHFMESQWIPDNTRRGWISDITKQVGGKHAVQVSKVMSPAIYKKRTKLLALDLPEERIPNGTFRWWQIPLKEMMTVARDIPSGTLLFVVRQDYHTTPYRITHVGIVMQRKSGTYLRHAKDEGAHQVVDMPLEAVVKRHAQFVKWPATGFSLYLPREPAKKIAAH